MSEKRPSLPKFIAAHAEALTAAAHAMQHTHVRNIGDAIAAAFANLDLHDARRGARERASIWCARAMTKTLAT